MYDLPKNIDLTFLKGKRLELICFAAYSLYLHFDAAIMITIEGSFEHAANKDVLSGKTCVFPLDESKLMQLLGHEIVEVSFQTDGTLQLSFSNKHVLIIQGDNGRYESYHIKYGERVITV